MREPYWIDIGIALALHGELIREHGGIEGLRSGGRELLESALARPQQRLAYEQECGLSDLAAAYLFGLSKNHCFLDGNKRIGHAAMEVFLVMNGYELEASLDDAERTFLALAAGQVYAKGAHMKVLVVGHRAGAKDRSIREALDRASVEGVFVASALSVPEVLNVTLPRCVLVDSLEGVAHVSGMLRERADCTGVPLIALVDAVSERTVVELHRMGADDIALMHDVGGLTRRLAALSHFDPSARTALSQGACLLAHADPHRRQLFGRVLRQAGFDVWFAGSTADALEVAQRIPPKILVVDEALPPHGGARALSQLARDWLGAMPAVLLSSAEASAPDPSVPWQRVDANGPPDDLLFVLNELLRPRELLESRASRRELFATQCLFREAGELHSRAGLTYNISREGLYVRTFDVPKERGEVWLDLRPPSSPRSCHLRGEIVWTRALATGARGAAPPGFGVRLDPALCHERDLSLYQEHYDALVRVRQLPSEHAEVSAKAHEEAAR